jgi:hypothetical protein
MLICFNWGNLLFQLMTTRLFPLFTTEKAGKESWALAKAETQIKRDRMIFLMDIER